MNRTITTGYVMRYCYLILILSVAGQLNADSFQNPAQAAKAQNWDAVHSLIEDGASVNSAMSDGASVLAWTVHWDNEQITEFLLRSGANPDQANDFGITPLHLACQNRSFPIIDLLLDAGADPNAKTWAGETVLMNCSRTGFDDGVNALLSKGAEINVREPEREQTALMWAAAKKHPSVVASLVEHGADIKARSRKVELPPQIFAPTYSKYVYFPETKGDFTPLMFAAQSGDSESARILLSAGADPNESTPEYGSALVLAAVNGHEDTALLLLEAGADPEMTDGYGITPLHWAVQEGISRLYAMSSRTDKFWIIPNMPRLVKALLDRGADPNARMLKDIPPYDFHRYARSRNNDIPQVRLAGATPFLLAAASGDMEIINLLLEANADPHIAAYETERFISSAGPGITPLMAAAGVGRELGLSTSGRYRYPEVVNLLIGLGGDVNEVGPGGRRAIHGAVFMGDTDIIRSLAEHGADLNAKDWYSQTAMSIALGDPDGFTVSAGPGVGRDDNSLRQSDDMEVRENVIELLLELGAEPHRSQVADRSGL